MKTRKPREFEPYARHVADRMGLRDWSIVVYDAVRDGDHLADVVAVFGRRCAVIHLTENFLLHDPAEQRQGIVHELTHCHFAAMQWIARRKLPASQEDTFNQQFEYGIDSVAAALAPFMPLPFFGKAKP